MDYTFKIDGVVPFGEGETPVERMFNGLLSMNIWDRDLLVQEKMDGWYGIAIKDENGNIRWQQGWQQYGLLQNLLGVLDDFMPKDSVLVVEVGHGTAAETEWAAKNGYHRMVLLDVPRWKGEDLIDKSTLERFKILQNIWADSKYIDMENPQIDIVNALLLEVGEDVAGAKQAVWDMFKMIYDRGGEGLIIKDCAEKYLPGKRSKNMWKMKKFVTKDYVVMGFEKSDAPTYIAKGMTVAAVKCGLFINGELKQVVKTSGFTFALRKEFSDNPDKYMGKVVELGGFEIFKSGSMRHPSLLRFREDRVPEDCVL